MCVCVCVCVCVRERERERERERVYFAQMMPDPFAWKLESKCTVKKLLHFFLFLNKNNWNYLYTSNIYTYICVYVCVYIYIYIYKERERESISLYICVLASRVECSPIVQETGVLIPGQVIPKTLKMVLDTSLLNTQQYKVHIKGKVEQSWERSSALPYTSV